VVQELARRKKSMECCIVVGRGKKKIVTPGKEGQEAGSYHGNRLKRHNNNTIELTRFKRGQAAEPSKT